jgi:Chaperone of endosialidase
MSATLGANITIKGSLACQGTLITQQFVTSNATALLLQNDPSFTKFAGQVGLGLPPTTQDLDLSTDLARKLTTSTWATGSDQRIKENIQTANLVRCAEIVDTLDLKYFEWKFNTEDKHALGWIAQDVQNFFPKSVAFDGEYLMLNSDQLVKVLYGALKHTQREFFPA